MTETLKEGATLLKPVAGYYHVGRYRLEWFHTPSLWHRFWMRLLCGWRWEDVAP